MGVLGVLCKTKRGITSTVYIVSIQIGPWYCSLSRAIIVV